MLTPSKFPALPFAADRFYRIMPFGDSLTSGTLTFTGWRGPLKRILGALGVSNWEYVGSQNNQQGYLGDFGRDWQHESFGGETVTQLTARIAGSVATHNPDVTVALLGANEGVADVETVKARFDRFFDAYFGATKNPIVALSLAPRNNAGAISMDAAIFAIIQGWRLSVAEQLRAGRAVYAIDTHQALRDSFHPYMFAGDNVHYNEIGYHRLALAIAAVVAARCPVATAPIGGQRVTALSGALDVAEGASVTKVASLDSFDVTTVSGRTFRVPLQWPIGVPLPAPVVRIHSDDVTGSGTVVVTNLLVSPHSPASPW